MRLLNCQLQNVRLHGDLSVAFSPRITLIGGANETGKSTLVEALHRALFLKATATGAPVEALQSRLHLGQPTVAIDFEAKGDRWTLRKRFSGASGQVSLLAESSGQPLNGAVAEEVLAELLGVKETLGSRQATTALPTRWAHLWVMQGAAGDNLLEAGKAHYDFDALLAQLEQSGGAAVQQSTHDQRVAQRVEAALEENFTTRGVKKNSPLWQRQEDLELAEIAMARALEGLQDYEEASAELAGIVEELEQRQNQDLPALEQRRLSITQGAAASARLDAAIELAAKALEPLRLRHDAAVQQLGAMDQLIAQLADTEQRWSALQQAQAGADQQEQRLQQDLETKREARTRLIAQRQQLEQRQQLLQLLSERARSVESLTRLSQSLQIAEQATARRRELEQQLASQPAVGRTELTALREAHQRWRDATTRQEAMAAGVRVLRSDQPIRIDGQPIGPGDQRQLSATFELQVGDGVALEITPGGGAALGDLQAQCEAAEMAYKAALTSLGVASVEAAEQLAEARTGLEQQLLALQASDQQDAQAVQADVEHLQQRLGELDLALAALAECRSDLEQEGPLPEAASALQERQALVSQTLTHVTGACAQSEAELDTAQGQLESFRMTRLEQASQLQVAEAERLDRQSRLSALMQTHGNRDGLAEQCGQWAQQRQEAEATLQQLQAERTALASGNQEQDLLDLHTQIEAVQRQIEQLIDRRGAAKQRCDSISDQDPYAAVEQARVQLEAASTDYESIKRLTDAQKLLQQLFLEAQADLSSRYSEPLALAIGSYLRPLVPDGPVAQLSYDQAKGFGGLQLRRGGEFYDFQQLSGGMREQLAAALRLSMADVLKGSHDGCLPLIFDDAFTNSDPDRVQLVKTMLETATERGLQVILLTCDPKAYGAFADQVVDLTAA
jgi:DNA repair exonuclease SbcCD ATPase subunit